jgi:ribosomal protein S12 methylthiotransferase
MARKVWIESLGCPKNEVDGERIRSTLSRKGFRVVSDRNRADVLILNTCGFIQSAKEESIEEIFNLIDLKGQNGRKKILVCGCLAQRYPDELWTQMPEVDGVFGIGQIDKVDSICSSALRGERTLSISPLGRCDGVARMERTAERRPYAYIKIADGCDNRCSYCSIPAIRGSFRSKRIKDVLEEAQQLVESGVKEINLIAQDTTLYGVDLYGQKRLPRLLASLGRVNELEWTRLLYTHPAHFSEELMDQIASNPKVCKYIDLPLQHISDEMLSRMHRKVNRKKVEQLIQRLRDRIPNLTLRTSFIVGFPGEKKRHFRELLDFVEDVRFDRLGAFPYSREEDTKAYDFKGQIPSRLKQERLDELMLTQQKIAFEKNRAKIGKTLTVLIENKCEERGSFLGRSQAEAPEVDGMVWVKGNRLEIGRFVKAEIVGWRDYDLIGQRRRK